MKYRGTAFFYARLCGCVLFFLCMGAMASAGPLYIADFPASGLAGWEEKKFQESTSYQLFQLENRQVLLAQSRNTASALIKKVRIDIEKFPFLNWSWRIENRLDTQDERTKYGDDYAARIYVVIDGGIFLWRTRAVNYVWANRAAKGEIWANAFAGKNAQMMALRNRQDPVSTWCVEKRNVYEDLKQVFGTQFHFIDAIAIMTDTDNTHGHAKTYYGDIYFSEK